MTFPRSHVPTFRRSLVANICPVFAVLLVSTATPAARACAVCYGDPGSPLARGVTGGVIVLLGFVALVLGGIAFVGGCWIARARRLHAAEHDGHGPRSLFLAE